MHVSMYVHTLMVVNKLPMKEKHFTTLFKRKQFPYVKTCMFRNEHFERHNCLFLFLGIFFYSFSYYSLKQKLYTSFKKKINYNKNKLIWGNFKAYGVVKHGHTCLL